MLSGAWDLTSPLHLWAGESGLGKSTLVHSLFLTDLYKERKLLSAEGEWAPQPCWMTLSRAPSRSSPDPLSPKRGSRPPPGHVTWERLGCPGVGVGAAEATLNHPPAPAPERISQTVEILKHTVDIEEKGVKLKLTIVDTPGFGDAVNNSEW